MPAAEEYQEEIWGHLQNLRNKLRTMLVSQKDLEKESQDLFNLTESEKRKAVGKFKELHQFLEEQEKCLLHEIQEVQKEIVRRRNRHLERLTRLSTEISSFERSILELGVPETQQVPESELLQAMKSTLQRYQKSWSLEAPRAFLPQLTKKASRFRDINCTIENQLEQFKDSPLFRQLLQKANITLDPNTAHPSLILSQDRKSVRMDTDQPDRFSDLCCVLGCEGFTAGRHFWEVDVGSGEWGAVGVAKKSVERKGVFPLRPEEGIWAVENWGDQGWAFTSPDEPSVFLEEKPRRIRVTVDYEGRKVSFSDADSGAELHTFSGASFSGDALYPFFKLVRNETQLNIVRNEDEKDMSLNEWEGMQDANSQVPAQAVSEQQLWSNSTPEEEEEGGDVSDGDSGASFSEDNENQPNVGRDLSFMNDREASEDEGGLDEEEMNREGEDMQGVNSQEPAEAVSQQWPWSDSTPEEEEDLAD